MKNKKHIYNKQKSVKTGKKNTLVWLMGIMLLFGTFIYTAYSKYVELPLIAGVMDDYKYNLTQQAAGVIPKNVKDNTKKSAGQIQAEAQLTLKEIAKDNPTPENIKIADNANRPENKKNISKKDQDAAEEEIKTQNTTISNDVVAIAKTAADRQAAAEKLAAEQAAAALAASLVANPADPGAQTPSNEPKDFCPGGNGTKFKPNSYVATGYGWANGARSTDPGTSQRECIFIDDKCGQGEKVACDVQYAKTPSQVVLPVSAGSEYIVGMTDAQIRERQKTDPNYKKPEVYKNCYDKSGVIRPTGSEQGDDRCLNGSWLNDKLPSDPNKLSPFDEAMKKTCVDESYLVISNQCGPTNEDITNAQNAANEAAKKLIADQEKNYARLKSPYSKNGCTAALKPGEKCVKSSDNSLLYMIVGIDMPNDVKVMSGVKPTTISSEIKKPPTIDTTFKGEKECADALIAFKSDSSCEPIAGGTYYKIVAKKDLPAPQRDYVKYVFGKETSPDSSVADILNSDQKSNLEDPSKEWSKDNPLIVDDWMDCPDNRNYKTLYRTSTREKTQYECGMPESVITANPVQEDDLAREATEGTIKAGESCVTNSSCESNDCRLIKNEDGKRDYYCMSTEIEVVNPDGWDNGIICSPKKPNQCKSGYCSDNIFNNTCETNPFSAVQVSNSTPNQNNAPAGKSAGELCGGYNADSACQSGECKQGIPPGGTEKDWYCMTSTNIFTTDVVAPDGTFKGKNGTYCLGRNDMCASNFCEINTGVLFFGTRDKCADNPFIDPSTIKINRTREQQQIENNQEKYKLIIAKDPKAFVGLEMSGEECSRLYEKNTPDVTDCIPLPGKVDRFVVRSEINDRMNELGLKKLEGSHVFSPEDCESGKVASIGAYSEGKNYICKPSSFCPEQDFDNNVVCKENGDIICNTGESWKPGIVCKDDFGLNISSDPSATNVYGGGRQVIICAYSIISIWG